jgi:hypothetical protein
LLTFRIMGIIIAMFGVYRLVMYRTKFNHYKEDDEEEE